MKDLLLVTYCCKSKNPIPHGIPQELYDSNRLIAFFNRSRSGMPRAILSYKYGLIPEDNVIDNYNLSKFHDINYLAFVVKQLVGDRRVIFYSPRKIVEKGWLRLLELAEVEFCIIRTMKYFKK